VASSWFPVDRAGRVPCQTNGGRALKGNTDSNENDNRNGQSVKEAWTCCPGKEDRSMNPKTRDSGRTAFSRSLHFLSAGFSDVCFASRRGIYLVEEGGSQSEGRVSGRSSATAGTMSRMEHCGLMQTGSHIALSRGQPALQRRRTGAAVCLHQRTGSQVMAINILPKAALVACIRGRPAARKIPRKR
jgi:hypothetical protein